MDKKKQKKTEQVSQEFTNKEEKEPEDIYNEESREEMLKLRLLRKVSCVASKVPWKAERSIKRTASTRTRHLLIWSKCNTLRIRFSGFHAEVESSSVYHFPLF